MTTTDEALTEQIARELFLHERWNFTDPRPQSEKTPEGDREMRDRMAARWDAEAGKPWHESEWPSFRQKYPRLAAAVLPIIRKAERDAARAALDGLIADTAMDVRLGAEGNDPQRVQDAEAVIDAAQIYRDIEYPEEAP